MSLLLCVLESGFRLCRYPFSLLSRTSSLQLPDLFLIATDRIYRIEHTSACRRKPNRIQLYQLRLRSEAFPRVPSRSVQSVPGTLAMAGSPVQYPHLVTRRVIFEIDTIGLSIEGETLSMYSSVELPEKSDNLLPSFSKSWSSYLLGYCSSYD